MNDHSIDVATTKITVAWVGMIFGTVNLSNAVLLATLIFTSLQIYKIVRDILRDRAKARTDSEAFAKAINAPEIHTE